MIATVTVLIYLFELVAWSRKMIDEIVSEGERPY